MISLEKLCNVYHQHSVQITEVISIKQTRFMIAMNVDRYSARLILQLRIDHNPHRIHNSSPGLLFIITAPQNLSLGL